MTFEKYKRLKKIRRHEKKNTKNLGDFIVFCLILFSTEKTNLLNHEEIEKFKEIIENS